MQPSSKPPRPIMKTYFSPARLQDISPNICQDITSSKWKMNTLNDKNSDLLIWLAGIGINLPKDFSFYKSGVFNDGTLLCRIDRKSVV